MAEPILQARNLTKHFGGLAAVDDVSLAVCPGQLHALIGPNGAGKSTLINLLSGELRATAGQILFQGARSAGSHRNNVRVSASAAVFKRPTSFPASPPWKIAALPSSRANRGRSHGGATR